MTSLENKIGYKFKDKALLKLALTHSSYVNIPGSHSEQCNERLEFLGDAVLSIISARYLYDRFPDMAEGQLTKLRSSLVCTESLSSFAKDISLGSYLLLGKGEFNNGGVDRPSLLEDAFEALIGAIYLDGGLENARIFVLKFLEDAIETHHINFVDYKSMLQEVVQQNPDENLSYVMVGESGPDHNKTFEYEVRLNSNVVGRGKGNSKKSAAQAAAKEALELMGL